MSEDQIVWCIQYMNTCIYCRGTGPFTDEHAIPAGLGGDDRRFMLKELVCATCNTKVFSPLEAAFLRSSPVAVARMFSQSSGRRRGSKRNPPSIQAEQKSIITADGQVVEIELGATGRPIVLPQIHLTGGLNCSTHATDHDQLVAFLEALRGRLIDTVAVVAKGTHSSDRLIVTTFDLRNGNYEFSSTENAERPPNIYIWHSAMDPESQGRSALGPRIFGRSAGQIGMRLPAGFSKEQALTLFRKAAHQIKTSEAVSSDVHQPLVHVGSMRVDIFTQPRVLAKIGINLLAFSLGAEYVTRTDFTSVKNSIMHNDPQMGITPLERANTFAPMFVAVPENLHVFALVSVGGSIALITRLYGSIFDVVLLSQTVRQPPGDFPIFFTADYTSHQVEMLSLREFATKYPPLGRLRRY
ncbi:HNH endonuclease [Paraburkholderia tropica]|uniref:hypothetical protein n=1 Tax=Paraburkholderia tropica TaxID=92647 RepID=UPI00160420C0|nr:hypothetical protein [Paraburkholderia tropica]QNB16148.1 HNH endonuclease [Paraburkholderia tropica]